MRLTKKNNRVTLVCGLAGFQMTSRQFLGLAIGSSPSVKRAPEQRFNLQRTPPNDLSAAAQLQKTPSNPKLGVCLQ
jgi:hypothetical protein